MIWPFVLVAIAILLFGLSLASVAGQTDRYEEELQNRRERDEQLTDRYYEFRDVHGREPSVRELWDSCPPSH